eukprot:CAMPEP_0185018476 /NCGR_PEP_ID=MMETSP1103-20130426/1187_1 /TAXON_ID=36769 /ORGANISM="Paraphysomonas bandaiensis, Strain Caron Lab Isolate" /LENGTH=134 /DNA_ID=CAMNT_0027548297 /DNA_START=147 /DNA_END=551 /DNA_ORIENTATION=-
MTRGGPIKNNRKGRRYRNDGVSFVSNSQQTQRVVIPGRSQNQQRVNNRGNNQPVQKQIVFPGGQRPQQSNQSSNQPSNNAKTQAQMKSGLATAHAIARDDKHPKREQALELIRAYQRGWVDSQKFHSVLQELVF